MSGFFWEGKDWVLVVWGEGEGARLFLGFGGLLRSARLEGLAFWYEVFMQVMMIGRHWFNVPFFWRHLIWGWWGLSRDLRRRSLWER